MYAGKFSSIKQAEPEPRASQPQGLGGPLWRGLSSIVGTGTGDCHLSWLTLVLLCGVVVLGIHMDPEEHAEE